MFGNQKSLKIDALKDQYGRVIYNRHDLYDMLYNGIEINNISAVDWHEDFEKFNQAIKLNHLTQKTYSAIEKLTLTKEEFDKQNQNNWYMPEEYKNLNLIEYFKTKLLSKLQQHESQDFYNSKEWKRFAEEYAAFGERGMENLLKYMIYLVDTMRKNGIVWGVGRGSSVASYVLYIIGIHRINSIKYNLDWREFLR